MDGTMNKKFPKIPLKQQSLFRLIISNLKSPTYYCKLGDFSGI